ncbi:MAG TPA: hypothetical protein VL179_05290 [Mycobacterium sp.]|nr:hypothetical protein [Mycobacterium sp.]
MAKHLANAEHALRVRAAIGGALTAGALLTAPVVVPAIAGVAFAEPAPAPAPSLNDTLNDLQKAFSDHQGRVTEAQATIKSGVIALDPSKVQSGLAAITTSRQTLSMEVQGIVRGSLGGTP